MMPSRLGLPLFGKNEVRIKLEGCGVCSSDLPLWEGREWFNYPRSPGEPGHEGWGIIDAVGDDVNNFTIRERVTGLTYHGFATHDIANPDHLVKLPDFLDQKDFPGEPLGCAMNIFSRADIQSGQFVAILGIGFIGLLLVQLARSAGARVIAISLREYSLEQAKKQGVEHLIKMQDHQAVIAEVKEITAGKWCPRVIEVTGGEGPLNLGIEITSVRGRLIVAGYNPGGVRQINLQLLNQSGIDLINAHERDPRAYVQGIKRAIEAIQLGLMDPFPFFTHRVRMQDLSTVFGLLQERPAGFIKALMINPSPLVI